MPDRQLHWVAEIAGVRREWDAEVIEQVPDEKVAWAATEGATNAGAVFFSALGPDRTSVRLHLEYEPEGVVEQVGDKLNIVEKQAESDLERFKSYIESRGVESGAWRGSVDGNVGTPDIEAAEETRGDSGKAGVSPKAVAAGAAAAAGVAAASALRGTGDSDDAEDSACPTRTSRRHHRSPTPRQRTPRRPGPGRSPPPIPTSATSDPGVYMARPASSRSPPPRRLT